MKVCNVNELVRQNFNVTFVNALLQHWRTTKSFQCFGAPKKQNLFLFLRGCKISYTDKDGRTFVAGDGDVVYTPIGSEYRAQMSDFEDASSHTVGINFFLQDSLGEDVILSREIQVFHAPENKILPLLFQKALCFDTVHTLLKSRIALMEILSSLASHSAATSIPRYITDSLEYLSAHIEESPTVAHLARLCNISEAYFRRQFQLHMGISPVEYRNSLRLERARSFLEYGEISVQEISAALGYATAAHFIKEFGRRYGMSPLQYRKSRQDSNL